MGRQQLSIYCLTCFWLGFPGLAVGDSQRLLLAQTQLQNSSLVIPETDPLLVPLELNRELSPLEKKRIRTEIVKLEKQAQRKFKQGDRSGAFSLWFRQLRLQRAIDINPEIKALGKIGKIAWQNNLGAELKVINQRLDEISLQQNADISPETSQQSLDTLVLLGNAYRQIRDLNQAIATFRQLLVQARQLDDFALEQKYLNILGKLYLGKFAYAEAASVYQELLELSKLQDEGNSAEFRAQVVSYYRQLGQIYNYLQQPEQAIATKKELIEYYQQKNITERLGSTQISLGDDYRELEKYSLAIASYTEAAQLGQSSLQLSLVSEALSKLSNLYFQVNQFDLAIQTTQELIAIEVEANNSYGVLTSYEQLGKIYLQLENYPKALNVFTQAQTLSRSLNYQTDYFDQLVETLQSRVKQ